MAKRKTVKGPALPKRERAKAGQMSSETVEPMVIALAEQLGSFLGRVRAKADGWLENDTLRQQVSQIRDGATQLLDRVNRAAGQARTSVAAKGSGALAPNRPGRGGEKKRKAPAAPKRREREGEKVSTRKAAKPSSAAAMEAPVRRLRKPPPQELFDPRLGEPMGKQMGQKNLRRRGRG